MMDLLSSDLIPFAAHSPSLGSKYNCSIITRLVQALGRCTDSEYCVYHKWKRNNLAMHLRKYSNAAYAAGFILRPDPALLKAIAAMKHKNSIAGSWQLMGEQRQWFQSRLARIDRPNSGVLRVAILGVPGVTHLQETVALIADGFRGFPIEFLVVDRCIRPLRDIAASLQRRAMPSLSQESPTRVDYIASGNLSFKLIHCDLGHTNPFQPHSLDLICSHLLFSFMTRSGAAFLTENIRSSLTPAGHMFLAQNVCDYMERSVERFFVKERMRVESAVGSWDLYQLTQSQCTSLEAGEEIQIQNNVQLLDMCP